MIKILIAISVLLFGCYTAPPKGNIIDCYATPEHPLCDCYTHCTRWCKKNPTLCTPEQLKELMTIGYVKDRDRNGKILKEDSSWEKFRQKFWRRSNYNTKEQISIRKKLQSIIDKKELKEAGRIKDKT